MNSKSVVAIALLSALALPVFAQTGAAAAPAATPAPAAAKADAAKTGTKHAAKHKTAKHSTVKKLTRLPKQNRQHLPQHQHQQPSNTPASTERDQKNCRTDNLSGSFFTCNENENSDSAIADRLASAI